ncbi:hypothetical protein [Robertmurraya sp.]|uniref:hypothetical protein n=1 Tax=Robertmurraya sp. TaxID=2837525 RepID=UPI003703F066
MKKIVLILTLSGLLSGCSSSLSNSQVEKKDVKQEIQSFISDLEDENGVNVYFDSEKGVYVYLNSANVKQGEAAVYITDFDVEENGDTLQIIYNTETTTDYTNHDLDHELLYKVNINKKYEYLKAYSDGKEVAFNMISGNE